MVFSGGCDRGVKPLGDAYYSLRVENGCVWEEWLMDFVYDGEKGFF